MILLHGNGVDHRYLLPLDSCLEGAERIHVDLAGFGGTPPLPRAGREGGGLPELADWLVRQIPSLVGERPFAVVGSSLGGLLARHLVAEYPGRVVGMALLAPVVDPRPRNRTVPEHTVLERHAGLLASLDAAARSEFTEIAVLQTPEVWERFESWALPGIRAASEPAMTRLARHYRLREVPEDRGAAVAGPVVVVVGEQDHVVGYSDQLVLAARYPGSRYARVAGAGHLLHLEQPEPVEQALAEWMYDTWRRS